MDTFVILVAAVLNGEINGNYVHSDVSLNNEIRTLFFNSKDKCHDKLLEYYVKDERPFPVSPSWEANLDKIRDNFFLHYVDEGVKVSYSCTEIFLLKK